MHGPTRRLLLPMSTLLPLILAACGEAGTASHRFEFRFGDDGPEELIELVLVRDGEVDAGVTCEDELRSPRKWPMSVWIRVAQDQPPGSAISAAGDGRNFRVGSRVVPNDLSLVIDGQPIAVHDTVIMSYPDDGFRLSATLNLDDEFARVLPMAHRITVTGDGQRIVGADGVGPESMANFADACTAHMEEAAYRWFADRVFDSAKK